MLAACMGPNVHKQPSEVDSLCILGGVMLGPNMILSVLASREMPKS